MLEDAVGILGRCCVGSEVWWSWRTGTGSSGPSSSARGSGARKPGRAQGSAASTVGAHRTASVRSSVRPIGPRPRWPAGSCRGSPRRRAGGRSGARPAPCWVRREYLGGIDDLPGVVADFAREKAAARVLVDHLVPGSRSRASRTGSGGAGPSRAGAGSSVCGHLAGGEAGQARTVPGRRCRGPSNGSMGSARPGAAARDQTDLAAA